MDYIKDIHSEMYARHDFPLPNMEKVTRNLIKQANFGLLPIREFAPLKLVIEFWFYL